MYLSFEKSDGTETLDLWGRISEMYLGRRQARGGDSFLAIEK